MYFMLYVWPKRTISIGSVWVIEERAIEELNDRSEALGCNNLLYALLMEDAGDGSFHPKTKYEIEEKHKYAVKAVKQF
jgi:hypothetical protein